MARHLVLVSNEATRREVLGNSNNLRDAVVLLRVWLRQRQLDKVGILSKYYIFGPLSFFSEGQVMVLQCEALHFNLDDRLCFSGQGKK